MRLRLSVTALMIAKIIKKKLEIILVIIENAIKVKINAYFNDFL